jgi:hypothetical protein
MPPILCARAVYNSMSVMTLSVDALQNGESNTSPQPIRVHQPKTNKSKGHQSQVLVFYTHCIPVV